ncbi:MAG: putative porin [Luteolibacter sp.]|nr:putative porin [Luteolibacter sp.]
MPHRLAAFFAYFMFGAAQAIRAQETPELPPVEFLTPDEIINPDTRDPLQPPATAAGPSTNVAVNLTALLVKKGLLTQEEGLALIAQAEAEAQAAAQAKSAPIPPAAEDELRVSYIPQTVRNNIRDEIKQELLAEARDRDWGTGSAPEWTSKFKPFGDLRGRYEGIFFADGNDNTGSFPNFNAINTGAPFDTTGTQFSPQYNVDEDRQRPLLRARLGTEIDIGDGFTGGLRVATGNGNSPVSPNQTLGGSGGNFSKYSLWLDRAFVSMEVGPGDGKELSFLLGRFDNPFFSTEVQWDTDLGFDGLGFKGKTELNDRFTTFYSGGLFPVFNTGLDFATNQPSKFKSDDKWLYGAQIGIDWKITEDLTAKFATAYYDFQDIEGKLSSPFVPLGPNDAGDTDASRPSFAQRGNTYRPIRNITPTAANGFGTTNQYQYYGLATPFRILTTTGRLDYDGYDPFRLSLIGEYSRNLAFNSGDIDAIAVNNRGSGSGAFEGGNNAWNLALQAGKPKLETRGDWLVSLGYRYVESDAVVDGFTDSEFGGGGTNVKGFSLGGTMALSPNVRTGIRWMSSDEIAGPPLGSDILQIELNAKF